MGINYNTSIVRDGLILYYDANNTQKSWKGRPVTNQFTLPTSDTNGFGVQNDTFTRIRSGTYGGYDILPTDYVWRYNITGVNSCPYHGWDIPTPSGTVVTFSFDFYVDPSSSNYPSTNYLANFENLGSGVSGSISDPTPTIKGVWKRVYFSSTATSTGYSRCLLYPGSCGTKLADSGFILYKNPQVEFNAPGSVPTPFVDGTRSNTQSIIDLTGTNTITANSLTYNSDGTFSFNGSGDFLYLPGIAASGDSSRSIFAWIKTTSTAFCIVSTGTPSNSNAFNLVAYSTQKLGVMGYNNDYYPSSGATINDNIWHQVGAVYDSGTLKTYVDAVLDNTSTGRSYSTTGQNNYVGKSNHLGVDYYFPGKINGVSIYNRALSLAEVKQNFDAQRDRYGV